MRLIEELENVYARIAEHVNYDSNIEGYLIDTSTKDSFWSISINDIVWADEEDDILEDSGNHYQSDLLNFFRGKDFSLALVQSDTDADDYWIVLDNNNELNIKEVSNEQ